MLTLSILASPRPESANVTTTGSPADSGGTRTRVEISKSFPTVVATGGLVKAPKAINSSAKDRLAVGLRYSKALVDFLPIGLIDVFTGAVDVAVDKAPVHCFSKELQDNKAV